jgi:putative Mg2+ transporter-C (MgtC) family protein
MQDELIGSLDAAALLRVAWRIGSAAVLGGLIGLEREWSRKPAGLRTHMTVAVAAATFVLIVLESGGTTDNVSQVIQGVAAGIGFLGAGTILKRDAESDIQGLTTAATIWLTAAVGIAAGAGHVAIGVTCVATAWLILTMLTGVERLVNRR